MPLLDAHLVYFTDKNLRVLVGTLLALPKWIVIIHDNDDLLGHSYLFSEILIINRIL